MPSIEHFVTLEQWGFPLAKIGDFLYIFIYNGKFQKVNVNTKNISTIYSYYADCFMSSVYDLVNNRLIGLGYYNPSGSMKSALYIVNLSDDSVKRITDNSFSYEFECGALDYPNNRLLIAESWNGIWSVPLDYIDNVSRWTRINTNISVYRWVNIAIFGNKVYAFVVLADASTTEIIYSSINSLSNWSVLDTSTVMSAGGLDVSDGMLAYSLVNSDGKICVKYTYDGENFTSVIVGDAPSDCVNLTLKIVGKYILMFVYKQSSEATDVYMVNVSDNNVYRLGSVSKGISFHTPVFDGQKTVYFIPSGIYTINFDYGRKLTMSINNPNPTRGQTIQISATLKDESENPVSGQTIYFYVVKESHQVDGFYGQEIGNAQTDESGTATISYQIPAGASGKLWFKALYKG